jgi:hypothetical protein
LNRRNGPGHDGSVKQVEVPLSSGFLPVMPRKSARKSLEPFPPTGGN